ncbi:hypothetical protein AJ80_00084 [Polytolypa hystricis UAMH7299]|uniref:Apple domain-containing protein n=1 Tax=Polytolypa hystricis (strain UAMH7299) TaxID=1447883 RepID=A0A2B7YVT1_POLH7|nr:hypothetical protein AJ80_00084 [Polytolypa hystricis UAMH7299]
MKTSHAGVALTALFSTAAIAQENCGLVGYDTGANPAILVYTDATLGTLEACGDLCSTTETCLSFGFSTEQCLLYNVTVTDNVNLMESPYTFYDLTCLAAGGATNRIRRVIKFFF